MSDGQWAGLIVFLVVLAFSLWLMGASVWDHYRAKKKVPAPKPVNALQDYHEFKAKLRAEARNDWSDEYRRMVSLGATKTEYIADCHKANVAWTQGNGWQVIPPDFDTRVRVDILEESTIEESTIGRVTVYNNGGWVA